MTKLQRLYAGMQKDAEYLDKELEIALTNESYDEAFVIRHELNIVETYIGTVKRLLEEEE